MGPTPTCHPNKEDVSCRSDNTPHEAGGIDMKHPANRAKSVEEYSRGLKEAMPTGAPCGH